MWVEVGGASENEDQRLGEPVEGALAAAAVVQGRRDAAFSKLKVVAY